MDGHKYERTVIRKGTSDRKQGLNELYMTVCKSVSRTFFRHFYLGTVSRLAKEKKNGNPNTKPASENIVLTDENRTDMRDIITGDPVLRILKSIGSAATGSILGGLPAAVLSGVIGTGIEFIVDLFSDGRFVGIDIDNASHKVEMEKLILSKIPAKVEMASA